MYTRYKTIIASCVVACIAYAGVAALGPAQVIATSEVFPFFSWSLFSTPYRMQTRYVLVLKDRDLPPMATVPGDPPPSGSGYDSQITTSDIGLQKIMNVFGTLLEQGHDVETALSEVRPHILRKIPDTYDGFYVVAVRFDAIDYYRDRSSTDEEVVMHYESLVR